LVLPSPTLLLAIQVVRLPVAQWPLTVKEKLALSALSMAFFAVTMYRVVVLTSVGVPLTVQVVPRFIQLILLLLSLKPMEQSQCGVPQILEAQVHPLVIAILRFIQILEPLSPLKPMAQSRRGAPHLMEVQPHALIDPSALRAAKAPLFE
jgi:hypothetical protein